MKLNVEVYSVQIVLTLFNFDIRIGADVVISFR